METTVSRLKGPDLDYWYAKASGMTPVMRKEDIILCEPGETRVVTVDGHAYTPSKGKTAQQLSDMRELVRNKFGERVEKEMSLKRAIWINVGIVLAIIVFLSLINWGVQSYIKKHKAQQSLQQTVR